MWDEKHPQAAADRDAHQHTIDLEWQRPDDAQVQDRTIRDGFTLSPEGRARVEIIRATLTALSAAIPGYCAAQEAVATLRGLGIAINLDDRSTS